MKSARWLIFLFIFSLTFLFAQEKTNIAVLQLDVSGLSPEEGKILTDRLIIELFKTNKYNVLEREKLESILSEQNFQLSGCTSTECLVEVGQLLGVQAMVGGSVGKFGNLYTINIRMIDVESGSMINQATFDYSGGMEKLLTDGLKQVAYQLAGLPYTPSSSSFTAPGGETGRFVASETGRKTARLGITIVKQDNGIMVTSVLPSSPAEKMGLRVNDRIIEVNNVHVENLSVQEVSDHISRGITDGQLMIKIDRQGAILPLYLNTPPPSPPGVKPARPDAGTSSYTLANKKVSFYVTTHEGMTYINLKGLVPSLESRGITINDKGVLNFNIQIELGIYFPKAYTGVFISRTLFISWMNSSKDEIHNLYSPQLDQISSSSLLYGMEISPINYFSFGIGLQNSAVKLTTNNLSGDNTLEFKTGTKFFPFWKIHFTGRNTPYKIGLSFYQIPDNNGVNIRYYNIFFGWYL